MTYMLSTITHHEPQFIGIKKEQIEKFQNEFKVQFLLLSFESYFKEKIKYRLIIVKEISSLKLITEI